MLCVKDRHRHVEFRVSVGHRKLIKQRLNF